VKRLLRNAAIGAAFCSYRALFYRAWDILPVLLAMGALSGCLYTLLEPAVRRRPRLHYLPWVLCAYLVIFGGVGVTGALQHDEESIQVLTNPCSSDSFWLRVQLERMPPHAHSRTSKPEYGDGAT